MTRTSTIIALIALAIVMIVELTRHYTMPAAMVECMAEKAALYPVARAQCEAEQVEDPDLFTYRYTR